MPSTLSPGDHVVMQAAVQKYIDSSISKTINCPADLSFEAFKDVYLQAYELGCKGCTTYRPERGHRRGAGGEGRQEGGAAAAGGTAAAPPPQPRPQDMYEAGGVVYMTQPLDRPEALPGQTYKLRWPESEHAIYITINDIVQDGRRRPFEIFINSKNMEHYAWTVGLTRMISAVFRRGGDVSFVVEELKAVFDPRGGYWMERQYVPSLLAAIGEVIERHMIDIGFMTDPRREQRRDGGPARAQGREPATVQDAAERAPAALPEMQPALPDPPGRLRPLHQLRLFEVQLGRIRIGSIWLPLLPPSRRKRGSGLARRQQYCHRHCRWGAYVTHILLRHSGESRNPGATGRVLAARPWTPAFAGVTGERERPHAGDSDIAIAIAAGALGRGDRR